jgi:HAE1 family hydrophobic/amphiphilic exporter-1
VYDLLDRRGDEWYVARGERHRAKVESTGADEDLAIEGHGPQGQHA